MSALILDAGAFVAMERGDRRLAATLTAARRRGVDLRTTAIVVAQVWRDARGRQVELARLLAAIDVVDVDDPLGRAAGVLIGRAQTSDPIDATVVLITRHGDTVLTSDSGDLTHLMSVAGVRADVVAC